MIVACKLLREENRLLKKEKELMLKEHQTDMFNSTSNLTMLLEDQKQQKLVEEMKEHFLT